MKLIPEIFPDFQKEVAYEDRLVDLEFRELGLVDRDEIDSFWTSIFYAHLSNNDRYRLSSNDLNIEGFQMFPSDYSLTTQQVGVVVAAYVSTCADENLYVGGAVNAWLKTNGTVMDEAGRERHYTDSMRPYVRALLAQVALSYEPLETDNVI